MERLYQPGNTPLADALPRLLFLEPLMAGRRVLLMGCADGELAQFLAEMGTSRVVGVERDLEAVEKGRAHIRSKKVDLRHYQGTRLPVDDGAFDVIIDLELPHALLNHELWRTDEYARILGGSGFLMTAVANPKGISPTQLLHGGSPPRQMPYEELVQFLSECFPQVAVYGQSPLLGFSFMNFQADPSEAAVGLDTGLMDDKPEVVSHYLLLAGAQIPQQTELTLVQLPFTELATRMHEQRALVEASALRLGGEAREEAEKLKAQLAERERTLAMIQERLPQRRRSAGEEPAPARTVQDHLLNRVEALGDDLSAAEREVRTMQQDLSDRQGEISHLRSENDQLLKQTRELQTVRHDLELSRLALQMADDKNAALQASLQQVRAQAESAETVREKAARDVEDARAAAMRAQQDHKVVRAELEALQKIREALQKTLEDNTQGLLELTDQLAKEQYAHRETSRERGELQSRLEVAQQDVGRLEAQLQATQGELQQLRTDAEEIERAALESETRAQELEMRLEEQTRMVAQLRAELDSLESEHSKTERELERLRQDSGASISQEAFNAVNVELDQARTRAEGLAEQLKVAVQTRDEAQRALVEVAEARFGLQHQLKDTQERESHLRGLLDIASQQVRAAEATRDDLQARLSSAQAELEPLRTRAAEAEQKIRTTRETLTERGRENGTLRDQLAAREQELAALKSVLAETQKHLESAEVQRADLQSGGERAHEEVEKIKAALSLAESELLQTRSSLQAAEQRLADVTATAQAADGLQAECERLRSDLAALKAQALAAEQRAEDAARETFLAREQRGKSEDELGRVRARLADAERAASQARDEARESAGRARDVEATLAEDLNRLQARLETEIRQRAEQARLDGQRQAALQEQASLQRADAEEARSQLSAAQDSAAQAQLELARLSRQGQLRSEHLQSVLDEAQVEARRRAADADHARSALEESQAVARQRMADADHARSALEEAQAALHKKDADLAHLRAVLEEAQQTASTNGTELEQLRAVLHEARTEAYKTDAELDHVRAVLGEAQETAARALGDAAWLRSVLEEAQTTAPSSPPSGPLGAPASMAALVQALKQRDDQVEALRAELKTLAAMPPQATVQGGDDDVAALRLRAASADQAWSEAADLKRELEQARTTLATVTAELSAVRGSAPAPQPTLPTDAVVAELEKQIAQLKEKVEFQGRDIKDKTERIARLTQRLSEPRSG